MSTKKKKLNNFLNTKKTTELHTHLMGMGDADFWINDILIKHIFQKNENILFPIEIFIEAVTGKKIENEKKFTKDSLQHVFESLFFHNMPENIGSIEDAFVINKKDGKSVISNNKLIEMMSHEIGLKNQPLRALLKNCFQFLNLNGDPANYDDVLKRSFFL